MNKPIKTIRYASVVYKQADCEDKDKDPNSCEGCVFLNDPLGCNGINRISAACFTDKTIWVKQESFKEKPQVCTSKDIIHCIQYTGNNREEVLKFLSEGSTFDLTFLLGGSTFDEHENDYLLNGTTNYKPAPVGTWFVLIDNHLTAKYIIRYIDEEEFFTYYTIKE